MPDDNKFKVLKSIKHHAAKVCGLCIHFKGRPGSWGACHATMYEHGKHGQKQLGVHAYGTCKNFSEAEKRTKKMMQSYAALSQ